jgi:hypothetical protein
VPLLSGYNAHLLGRLCATATWKPPRLRPVFPARAAWQSQNSRKIWLLPMSSTPAPKAPSTTKSKMRLQRAIGHSPTAFRSFLLLWWPVPAGLHRRSERSWPPDGRTVLTAGGDRMLRFWDVATGRPTRRVQLQGKAGPGRSVTLSPDGKTVLLAAWVGKQLVFWEVESGKELKTLPAKGAWGYLAFAPDGKTLAVGRNDWQVSFWDWQTGKEREFWLPFHPRGVVDRTVDVRAEPFGPGAPAPANSGLVCPLGGRNHRRFRVDYCGVHNAVDPRKFTASHAGCHRRIDGALLHLRTLHIQALETPTRRQAAGR